MSSSLTAAILVIGNEILSGSTQETNVSFIAQRLSPRGIKLSEVRIVRDEEEAIAENLNALRAKYTYVFTTGGIGPTHDDITAAAVAKAFGVRCVPNNHAKQLLEDYYAPKGTELNEARLRMAQLPEGVLLIKNPVSSAPGFHLGNVFVLAGVPKIMQSMFEHVETFLDEEDPLLSVTILCNQREADIAQDLGKVQSSFREIEIGSYPQSKAPILKVILRGTERASLDRAAKQITRIIADRNDMPQVIRQDD